jgi:hypothetical protein
MRLAMAAAVLAVPLGASVTPSMADSASDPLAQAAQAARSLTFSGDVTVRWVDQRSVAHSTTLHVDAGNGVVRIGGAPALAASTTDQRWLFRHGEWDLVSPVAAPASAARRPAADVKYSISKSDGPAVAGRPTTVSELRVGGVIRERLYLDQQTNLLLRRDLLDAAGYIVRTVAYENIALSDERVPRTPDHSVDRQPAAMTAVRSPYRAPASLAGGYERIGMFRRDGAVQVVYSDGVHTLSLFEQSGRLDRSALPEGGDPVRIGSVNGVRLEWSGGQVVVWAAGPSTYTLVGDGSSDDVLAAAGSVPWPAKLSMWQRVHRACAGIVDAVSVG